VWPVPAFPYSLMPYVILFWAVVGLILLARLRAQNPTLVGRLGRIMGEEGETAEAD
jgi:hypothetical protein